jgi:hypothetical protein
VVVGRSCVSSGLARNHLVRWVALLTAGTYHRQILFCCCGRRLGDPHHPVCMWFGPLQRLGSSHTTFQHTAPIKNLGGAHYNEEAAAAGACRGSCCMVDMGRGGGTALHGVWCCCCYCCSKTVCKSDCNCFERPARLLVCLLGALGPKYRGRGL